MCLKSETSFFIRNCQKKSPDLPKLQKTTKKTKEISKIFSKSAFHQFWLEKLQKTSKMSRNVLKIKNCSFRKKIKKVAIKI